MPDILTRTEVEALAERGMRSVPGSRLDPASVTKRGSTANVLLVGGAGALAEEVQRRAYAKLAALTRSGAKGDELDAVIYEQTFGEVVRLGAEPATVTVKLSRAAAGTAGTVRPGTVCKAGSIGFALEYAVPFGASTLGPIEVTATATSAGSATNVGAGKITAWENTTDLFDPKITVTNDEDAAGGEETELDAALVVRAAQWALAARRGTLEAIAFGAQQEGKVRNAIVEEDLFSGHVIAYIADSNGNANRALCDRVTRRLLTWRAAGIRVTVIGSAPSYVTIVLAPGYLDGASTADVQELARAAIVAAVNQTPPKTRLQRSLLFATLRSIPGLVVDDGAIVSPVGDLVPIAGQSFRTRADLVAFE